MMLRTQETLDGEIIVDSFAGGGLCFNEFGQRFQP